LAWFSTPAHIAGQSTPYVDVAPALVRIHDFAVYVSVQD